MYCITENDWGKKIINLILMRFIRVIDVKIKREITNGKDRTIEHDCAVMAWEGEERGCLTTMMMVMV